MSKKFAYDICGWATKNDIRCSDGRTIRRDAFKDCDGAKVPLVYQHNHSDINNVLGHAILQNRPEGVWYWGAFNNTPSGQAAKEAVAHGDLSAISIYANQLQQTRTGDVHHGMIRELSLAIAAANPGATIEFPMLAHTEETMTDRAVIRPGDEYQELFLQHGEIEINESVSEPVASGVTITELSHSQVFGSIPGPVVAHADDGEEDDENGGEKTVKQIFDAMTEEQKDAVYQIVGGAMAELKPAAAVAHSEIQNGGASELKTNAFDVSGVIMHAQLEDGTPVTELSHAQLEAIADYARRNSTLKEAILAHADEYGIKDIEWLFPEARNINNPPDWIKRPDGWVTKVLSSVHHTPFSRIKTMQADITADEARAKGYVKGNKKIEEVFTLLKRTTEPQTVYKKQKFDRDDIIDITDFDLVAWVKAEMRMMLDEELARAFLIGDGRSSVAEDKIKEDKIRPIWKDTDGDLYAVRTLVDVNETTDEQERGKKFIRAAIRARKNYRGSGNPTLFTTEDFLTDMLLIEDGLGHLMYDSVTKLATTLRVKEIVTVPVMENAERTVGEDVSEETFVLMGIIVNLSDYNVGADKGGAVAMFDDFDIDFNQYKYLIETRCSGALIRVKSALVFEYKKTKTGVPGAA